MLLQLDRSAPHGLDSPLVAESLEQTIMTTLLLTQAHNYSERLAAVLHAAPSRRIQAAVDLIHAEKSPVMLDVTAIARHIEVSVRALQLAFQKELGTSPSAYLRDVRLDQVRSILLSGTPETTSIAQTAGDWGFGNLGRFAAAYRRKFGEAPSETVHRR
jgi:transcriptional regulator GlxA family with amidase domain